MSNTAFRNRFHGAGLTRWLHLLFGHEEPQTPAKSDRNEQIEVQIWVSTTRNCYIICYVGWLGLVQNLQLSWPEIPAARNVALGRQAEGRLLRVVLPSTREDQQKLQHSY